MQEKRRLPFKQKTKMSFLRFVVVVLLALVMACAATQSPNGMTLDKAVAKLSAKLVRQGGLKDSIVLISPQDFYDAESGLSLPLANQLRVKFMTEMKARGVRVFLPGATAQDTMILQGTWQTHKDQLVLDAKVMKYQEYGPEAISASSVSIPLEEIDRDALTPDRQSWARYLVRNLDRGLKSKKTLKLYIKDFKIGSDKGDDELGGYLKDWIRPALSDSRLFKPLDEGKALIRLTDEQLKERTRTVAPELASEESTLNEDLMRPDADGTLRGKAWFHHKDLEIKIYIIDNEGVQIGASEANVPKELFPPDLIESPGAVGVATVVGPKPALGLSIAGMKVELSTDKGQKPVYYDGEYLRFVVRPNLQAQVYLFNINSEGDATLLFPIDEKGLLNSGGGLVEAGKSLVLPGDGMSYKLKVGPPFGLETIWAVAAGSPLNLPRNLSGDWKSSSNLVKRLRDQGSARANGYSETYIKVQTAAKTASGATE